MWMVAESINGVALEYWEGGPFRQIVILSLTLDDPRRIDELEKAKDMLNSLGVKPPSEWLRQ